MNTQEDIIILSLRNSLSNLPKAMMGIAVTAKIIQERDLHPTSILYQIRFGQLLIIILIEKWKKSKEVFALNRMLECTY